MVNARGWNVCLKSWKEKWYFYFVLPHHNPFLGQLEYYLTMCFYCKEPAPCPHFLFLLPLSYGIIMCNTIVSVGLLQVSHFHWEFLWVMAHGKTCSIYSADPLDPDSDCIALSQGRYHIFHSPSCFPICSKFISIQRSLSLTQDWEEDLEMLLSNKDWGANRIYNTAGEELAPTWRFLLKFSNYMPSLNTFVFIASVIIQVNNIHSLAHMSNQGSKD